ncbi:MAG: hypothetical protein GAK30_00069 [Paracidovorax wautersii]|uniref:FAD-binding FR-type domain-containing protein n=1 Tax=Paracidovorax wautersii TaxID=1177982 RepID=A0A7V8JSA9_9BURK|nr:MAG: hypothetical protein GAK30_00069 [Paracidovorax wautersii]
MSHDRPPQLHGPATLVRKQTLTPRLLRLVFHAPALAGMAVHKPAHALHVWFGPRGDGADKATRRVFTLRQFDPATALLAIDVLLHEDGLAARWAVQAQPGQTLEMAGPRSGFAWTPGADWLLAVVDESAMPALATLVEQLPAHRPIHALLALRHEDERAYFDELQRHRPALRISHVRVDDRTAGTDTALIDALASARWPAGAAIAFVAGESQRVKQVRGWLAEASPVDWLHIHASGYWQHDQAAYGHG